MGPVHRKITRRGFLLNKKIILLIIVILLSGIAYSAVRTPTTPWYEVEDWEIEVCSKFAGQSAPDNAETETGYFSYGTTSMTIQAFKSNYGDEYLYEVYYYIEPYTETQTYSIHLVNENKRISHEIASGTIGVNAGAMDYYTNYSALNFNEVRMVHKYGAFKVPIIQR
ncbi:hypothetical protein GF358_03455 [Candidatus Woesearchaeota archaeon]|nr:hypothetical protein [Candidatus Woesearchaeota archaeon]